LSDFLHDRRKEITDRLKELKPVVDEYHRLEAAVEALGGVIASAASEAGSAAARVVSRPTRGRGRPRGSAARASKATPASASAPAKAAPKTPSRPKASTKKAGRPAGKTDGAKKGGRPKGSGKRAGEVVSFVQGQPGITLPELAAKMGIKQNYLYRVMPALEQDGKVEKKGRGWHPKS
jgi:hypothetical protein